MPFALSFSWLHILYLYSVMPPLLSDFIATKRSTRAKGQVEAEERQEAEVEEKAEGKHDEKAEPSSSTSEPSSQRSTAGNDSVAAAEERKPLFEISAEQIEASAQQRRLDELQQEFERRKKAGAGAGAGSSSAAQQE